MTADYDVVVVGARLAGSSTAMLLARSGHRVLLVERASMPSDTVSTHAMLRSGVLQLTRWGLLDRVVDSGAPPVTTSVLGFGDERISVTLRTDHGVEALYAPRRYVLDSILFQAAVEAGVEARTGTRLTALSRGERGSVDGVVLEDRTGECSVSASLVVGADGAHSRVAELVGATEYLGHPPSNAIHYAYFEGLEHDGFRFQFTPGVNAGLIPTNDDQVLAFVGRPSASAPAFSADPDGEFERLLSMAGTDIRDMVGGATRVSPYRGTPGLAGSVRVPWGDGWALVGDAGYTKDPISAHGMSDALRDAELCARAIDAGLRDPAEASRAMSEYHAIRDRLSRPLYEESTRLARYQWGADEASRRMRVISDAVRDECALLESLPAWGTVSASAA